MNRSTEYFVIVNSDEDFTIEPKIIQQYDIQLTTGWEETSNGDLAKGKLKIAIQYIWRNQRDEFPIGTEVKVLKMKKGISYVYLPEPPAVTEYLAAGSKQRSRTRARNRARARTRARARSRSRVNRNIR